MEYEASRKRDLSGEQFVYSVPMGSTRTRREPPGTVWGAPHWSSFRHPKTVDSRPGFTRSRRWLKNRNQLPSRGSAWKTERTRPVSPSKLLRMSVGGRWTSIFTWGVRVSITALEMIVQNGPT